MNAKGKNKIEGREQLLHKIQSLENYIFKGSNCILEISQYILSAFPFFHRQDVFVTLQFHVEIINE